MNRPAAVPAAPGSGGGSEMRGQSWPALSAERLDAAAGAPGGIVPGAQTDGHARHEGRQWPGPGLSPGDSPGSQPRRISRSRCGLVQLVQRAVLGVTRRDQLAEFDVPAELPRVGSGTGSERRAARWSPRPAARTRPGRNGIAAGEGVDRMAACPVLGEDEGPGPRIARPKKLFQHLHRVPNETLQPLPRRQDVQPPEPADRPAEAMLAQESLHLPGLRLLDRGDDLGRITLGQEPGDACPGAEAREHDEETVRVSHPRNKNLSPAPS